MHGIRLTRKPEDWQIIQQENGVGECRLEGSFQVHPAAIEVGVECVRPVVRVMRETDNLPVLPWTPAESVTLGENFSGSFTARLKIPAGGLYRIETSLETKSTVPDLTWLYRGDCALHIGVGNVFVIAGQSNAAGYGRDYAADPPHLCVHLYRNRGKWDLACHPLNESTDAGSLPNEEMGIPGVSPYLSFGKTYHEFSGMPVGLVQTARGGSAMDQWSPGGDLYENMLRAMKAAGGKFAGVLWYQGCEDTRPELAKVYPDKFLAFTLAVRKELGYEIPFFTFQLNRQLNGLHDEAWGQVREAQRRAAVENPGVYCIPTTNCSQSDAIHNSAQANLALGERLAKLCAHVLDGGEEFEAPTLEEAGLLTEEEKRAAGLEGEAILRLTFGHVKVCFLLYSGEGKDSGFTLEDGKGRITVRKIRANRQDGNHVYLTLDRGPEEDAVLSFAWEADPVRAPLVDEATYLPPLSFYQVKIFQ